MLDSTGWSVDSAGDFNGDGIVDTVIGAPYALCEKIVSETKCKGQTYIVFGNGSGFSKFFQLSQLNGENGFVINGINYGDQSGYSVSGIGDVNNDRIDDVVIGAPDAFCQNTGQHFCKGQSYVVFGSKNGFQEQFNLTSLNGNNGFVINGINYGDQSGYAVSNAGDINNDHINDIIIGAPFAPYATNTGPGQSYVVFGNKNGFQEQFNLANLNGDNGFVINGVSSSDKSGYSIASAGDINGDGIDDIVIGAPEALSLKNGEAKGQSYAIFGSEKGFNAQFSLTDLNGDNGFAINGINYNDQSGWSVSGAGDVNGDNIYDITIGAPFALCDKQYNCKGQSYVLFGSKSGFLVHFELSSLDGSNGFVINGSYYTPSGTTHGGFGSSVNGIGDVNSDGFADLAYSDTNLCNISDDDDDTFCYAKGYVIFGKGQFANSLNVMDLTSEEGFTINFEGTDFWEGGTPLIPINGIGDINNDGNDDMIIGNPSEQITVKGSDNINFIEGAYIIYGQQSNGPSPNPHKNPANSPHDIGDIVGGAVGGAVVIGAIVGLVLYGKNHGWWCAGEGSDHYQRLGGDDGPVA